MVDRDGALVWSLGNRAQTGAGSLNILPATPGTLLIHNTILEELRPACLLRRAIGLRILPLNPSSPHRALSCVTQALLVLNYARFSPNEFGRRRLSADLNPLAPVSRDETAGTRDEVNRKMWLPGRPFLDLTFTGLRVCFLVLGALGLFRGTSGRRSDLGEFYQRGCCLMRTVTVLDIEKKTRTRKRDLLCSCST